MRTTLLLLWISLLLTNSGYTAHSIPHDRIPLFRNDDIRVDFLYKKDASYLDSDWLGFEFTNTGTHTMEINRFTYRIECEAIDDSGDIKKRHGLGQGDKYGVFPVFEGKSNPSDYDALIPGNKKIWCWRGPSHYAAALLGHDNPKRLSVEARLFTKIEYTVHLDTVELKKSDISFSFKWNPTTIKTYDKLAEKLKRNLDTAHLNGNGLIICDLIRDPEVSTRLPISYYKELIKKREPALEQNRREIMLHITEYSKDNVDLVQNYLSLIPKADWTVFQDLSVFWDDKFLPLLVDSFEKNNKHHSAYLGILDRHADLWKDNDRIKERLFKIVMKYVSEILVSQEKLASAPQFKLVHWATWCKSLSMTRHKKAETYLRTFLDNKRKVYEGNLMVGMPVRPAFVCYRARRVCDIAFENIIRLNDRDLEQIYVTAFIKLNKAGMFKRSQNSIGNFNFSTPFKQHNPLMDEEIMLRIRDHLITEMKNSDN